jgi:hypothetical protein
MCRKDKRQFWQGHVTKFKQFSGPRKAYCQQEGIKSQTLQYWIKKLNKAPSTLSTMPFVPITVVEPKVVSKGLPDPVWLAQFILTLQEQGGQR